MSRRGRAWFGGAVEPSGGADELESFGDRKLAMRPDAGFVQRGRVVAAGVGVPHRTGTRSIVGYPAGCASYRQKSLKRVGPNSVYRTVC
jgi:hypothetical protein